MGKIYHTNTNKKKAKLLIIISKRKNISQKIVHITNMGSLLCKRTIQNKIKTIINVYEPKDIAAFIRQKMCAIKSNGQNIHYTRKRI